MLGVTIKLGRGVNSRGGKRKELNYLFSDNNIIFKKIQYFPPKKSEVQQCSLKKNSAIRHLCR
jgi:hypothetical protein